MTTPTRLTKQEQTYATLRARILDGTYGPGHRLVIDALARELSVSQLPVREAIRRLEAEGWVVYQRNSGAQVTPVDPSLWVEGMETFAVLEGYVTRLAAPRIGPAELARLRAANDEMRDAMVRFDIPSASAANSAFHEVFYDHCPNAYLRRQLEATVERLSTVRAKIFSMIPDRLIAMVDEHAGLIDLVASGAEPLEIEMAAREHKLRTVRAYEERWATLGG
jgi:DNA-binding GntR family transcriptional regulator